VDKPILSPQIPNGLNVGSLRIFGIKATKQPQINDSISLNEFPEILPGGQTDILESNIV
jgi:hypothetical protein